MSKPAEYDRATHYQCNTGEIFPRAAPAADHERRFELTGRFALMKNEPGVPAPTIAEYGVPGTTATIWLRPDDQVVVADILRQWEEPVNAPVATPEPPTTHTLEVIKRETTETKRMIGIRYPLYLIYEYDDDNTERWETHTRVEENGTSLEIAVQKYWRSDDVEYTIQASKCPRPDAQYCEYFDKRFDQGTRVYGRSYGFDPKRFDELYMEIAIALGLKPVPAV